jgi:hypothetical protein
LNEAHWFLDDGHVFDFASAVAVTGDCSSAPCCDEGGVFDLVADVIWQVGQLCGYLGEQVADCFAGCGSMLGEVASTR